MSDQISSALPKTVTRRTLLGIAGGGAIAVAGLSLGAGPAQATPADVDTALRKIIGDKKTQSGRIVLKVPEIAENGATVPFTVSVDSPMTEQNYVKEIHVFAEQNPLPNVASFALTPAMGKAEVSSRTRLARTQNLRAVAILSDGTVHETQKEIKVTIGGCGG